MTKFNVPYNSPYLSSWSLKKFVTTTAAGLTVSVATLKAASSTSSSAVCDPGVMFILMSDIRQVAIPLIRFAPDLLATYDIPFSFNISAIILDVVVLPLVPVIMNILYLRDNSLRIPGYIFIASFPGKDVPPEPATRNRKIIALAAITAMRQRIKFIILFIYFQAPKIKAKTF